MTFQCSLKTWFRFRMFDYKRSYKSHEMKYFEIQNIETKYCFYGWKKAFVKN